MSSSMSRARARRPRPGPEPDEPDSRHPTPYDHRRPPPPPANPPPPSSSKVEKAIAFAKAQLGEPYKWGGAGPGSWDCSGLTMRAWQAAGINLPHYAGAQYANTKAVPISKIVRGRPALSGAMVGRSSIYHEALYLGGGQDDPRAETGSHRRDRVAQLLDQARPRISPGLLGTRLGNAEDAVRGDGHADRYVVRLVRHGLEQLVGEDQGAQRPGDVRRAHGRSSRHRVPADDRHGRRRAPGR